MAMTPRQRAALDAGRDYVAARELDRALGDEFVFTHPEQREKLAAVASAVRTLKADLFRQLAETLAPEPAAVNPAPAARTVNKR